MAYTVKWICDHLGISRKALRYYEKENILSKKSSRNPNNGYREYDDDDVTRIWCIKLLIGIGFTAKEIYKMMNDVDFDFQTAIAKKVEELEIKKDELRVYTEIAKTIKQTGMLPTVTKMGSYRFDEFMQFVKENWNLYSTELGASFGDLIESIQTKKENEWTSDDLKALENVYDLIGPGGIEQAYNLNAYYRLLSELKFMEPSSELVQTTVRLLYEYTADFVVGREKREKLNKKFFARYISTFMLGGDIAAINEKNFGKDGCRFIAEAVALFAGYKSLDEFEKGE